MPQWMLTDNFHVIPLDDYRPHTQDTKCWCHPRRDEDYSIVHNSMDEREKYEAGELKVH